MTREELGEIRRLAGKCAAGVPKNYSAEERAKRAERIKVARDTYWTGRGKCGLVAVGKRGEKEVV